MLNGDKLVQNISNKFKLNLCKSSFKYKEELKEHWTKGTEIFCKTCKICCVRVSTRGTNEVNPDDPEHEGHELKEKEKNVMSVFLFVSQAKL